MENCYHAEEPSSWDHLNYQTTATDVSNESSSFQVPWPQGSNSSTTPFQFYEGFQPPSWSSSAEEDRAASASKSHSQAEKRRRDRINAQLATLRNLIPQSDKMDKAALLGSVIDEVKNLKRKAMEVTKAFMVPTEIDDISVSQCELSPSDQAVINSISTSNQRSIMIRASLCCDDQPELFAELIQVLKGLKLTAVKADIASAGGRIKSVLVLCSKDGDEAVSISSLKQELKLLVTKFAAASSATQNCRIRSKRQRFFLPLHYPK